MVNPSSLPKSPIQPILPNINRFSAAYLTNAPLLCVLPGPQGCELCGHKLFAQNKPKSQNRKTIATSCSPKTYNNIWPRRTRKNKPNQTQFQPKTRALLDTERSRRPNQTQTCRASIESPASRTEHLTHLTRESWPDYAKRTQIPQAQKPTQPFMSQRLTPSFRSPPLKKNKPNQTQLVAAKPARGGAKPDTPRPAAPRFTTSDMRHATCDIRNTKSTLPAAAAAPPAPISPA